MWIFDGHNDLPMQLREVHGSSVTGLDQGLPGLHTDLPRLRAGGLGAQFWSVYVPSALPEPEAVTHTLEQIDVVHRMIAEYPDAFEAAYTADDVERIVADGRIASLIGIEGGHSLARSPGVLRSFARLGVRYVTLTHNHHTAWADSAAAPPVVGGLTAEGLAMVREMQRIGVLVDLSHVATETMHAALDDVAAPVIFSHSGARAITDHARNVPDDVLERLPANGGVVQIPFVAYFVSSAALDWFKAAETEWERLGLAPIEHDWPRGPRAGESAPPLSQVVDQAAEPAFRPWLAANPRPEATVSEVADHVEHARAVAGVDHVGIGADFDGTPDLPVGLADVAGYPNLFAELQARGWSDGDLRKLAHRNVLRVMRETEQHATAPLWPSAAPAAAGDGSRDEESAG
ncbi:dipeptidase [Actinoplanes sp. L3-i22]|uniref:dipeptidase n=1 Tax=Actinoplanes sp. L3-i22 TaxID=2836373 RepID=UPI001C747314|nr:dipeptidase [Actinoplanes sp. L3-i22]BCY07862.1 dipeptidase [Actinoplanes sp. L3-i22]